MFVVLLTLLFVSIHCGQAAIEAKADLRLHNTSTSIGILTFSQADANSEVKIVGTLSTSFNNTYLVCENESFRRKSKIFLFVYLKIQGFSCSCRWCR